MPIFLGVDPGQTGALAIVKSDVPGHCGIFLKGMQMPTVTVGKNKTKSLDNEKLMDFLPTKDFICILEHVSAMPGQGVSSTFQFGRMFGAIEAAMDMTAEEIIYVRPRVWKAYWSLGQDKQESLIRATELYGPCEDWMRRGRRGGMKLEENAGVAEAALLAAYGAVNHERS